jgi:hypothetical protein
MSEADTATTPAPAPVVTCTAYSAGSSPESVALTVDGTTWIVDVGCDRDDWSLPEVDDAIAHRVLWAVDDAIEAWHRDNEPEVTRQERTWARRVA